MTDNASPRKRNIFSNFILGVRVLASEIQWLGMLWLRRQEIRQLTKRLGEEQAGLGSALAAHLETNGPKDPAREPLPPLDAESLLAYKQVLFLKQELHHLQNERGRIRDDFVARRKARLGMS